VTVQIVAAAKAAEASASAVDGFDVELASILKQSLDARKPLVFHLAGSEVAGVVKEIRHGTVIVSNHEHPRILIRLSRIDAVESN
jgi:hypothetical protein